MVQTAVKNREAKGNSASPGAFPRGGARRALSGLPVRRQLETRSPVSAAPPGRSSANASAPAHFPEAVLDAPCPGYQSADGWKNLYLRLELISHAGAEAPPRFVVRAQYAIAVARGVGYVVFIKDII